MRRRTTDMELAVMSDGVLSDGERERLRKIKAESLEMLRLAETRITVRTESLKNANERECAARARNDAARLAYEEALVTLAPDEDEDYATELTKREKFEIIEAEYLAAGLEFQCAELRASWELREMDKWGLGGQK